MKKEIKSLSWLKDILMQASEEVKSWPAWMQQPEMRNIYNADSHSKMIGYLFLDKIDNNSYRSLGRTFTFKPNEWCTGTKGLRISTDGTGVSHMGYGDTFAVLECDKLYYENNYFDKLKLLKYAEANKGGYELIIETIGLDADDCVALKWATYNNDLTAVKSIVGHKLDIIKGLEWSMNRNTASNAAIRKHHQCILQEENYKLFNYLSTSVMIAEIVNIRSTTADTTDVSRFLFDCLNELRIKCQKGQ